MTNDEERDTGQEGGEQSLADKLNHLFSTIHPPGRGEYSLEDVAEAISARGSISISTAYLSQLRKGIRANPSKNVLEALAEFFGISPVYFFDDEQARRIEAELALLGAMRNAEVRQIALRAAELSPESLRNLAALIEHLRDLERRPRESQRHDGSPE